MPESLRLNKSIPLGVNPHLKISSTAKTLKEARDEFERSFILGKLEEYEWNVTKTADAIGVERSSLHRKLRAYQIDSQKLKG